MIGAIIGDIIGSPYEFLNVFRADDIEAFRKTSIFREKSHLTDDSVLTFAVADALNGLTDCSGESIKNSVRKKLIEFYKKYPVQSKIFGFKKTCYGPGFEKWCNNGGLYDNKSTGNGAAMRIAPVGWMYNSLEETLRIAGKASEPTHNSIDAINGAKAISGAIYIGRTSYKKPLEYRKRLIKFFLENYCNYDLDSIILKIKVNKTTSINAFKAIANLVKFDQNVKSNVSVPLALGAVLSEDSFEATIIKAVTLGGDSDTIACMAGAVSEALYINDANKGIPEEWINKTKQIIKNDSLLNDILDDFTNKYQKRIKTANCEKELERLIYKG